MILLCCTQHGKDKSTEELISKKMYPKREEFQWRPTPLLCKRFEIVDPYMGKVRSIFFCFLVFLGVPLSIVQYLDFIVLVN